MPQGFLNIYQFPGFKISVYCEQWLCCTNFENTKFNFWHFWAAGLKGKNTFYKTYPILLLLLGSFTIMSQPIKVALVWSLQLFQYILGCCVCQVAWK